MSGRRTLAAVAALVPALISGAAGQAAPGSPSPGWLVLHGGGRDSGDVGVRKFVEIAGGPAAKIAVVMTALDAETLTPDVLTRYRGWWKNQFGVSDVTLVDTRDRRVADTDSFTAPIRGATGVWINGGHLEYLLTTYLGTETQHAIAAVARRGGVVGGSSAGAMIQGSMLLNLTKSASGMQFSRNKMFLDLARLTGFGLLENVAIYPHVDARGSRPDLVELVQHYPETLGIAIDEDTAVIVHGDRGEVIGKGHASLVQTSSHAARVQTYAAGRTFSLARVSRSPVPVR